MAMIQRYKGWFTLAGFLLLAFGLMSIILSMVGLRISFLAFLDAPGPLFGFVIKLVMAFSGVIIMTLARTDWASEEDID
jgi:hypothetical protein